MTDPLENPAAPGTSARPLSDLQNLSRDIAITLLMRRHFGLLLGCEPNFTFRADGTVRVYTHDERFIELSVSEVDAWRAKAASTGTLPRPMTGLWAKLTPEQRQNALAYKGPENHGDPAFEIGPKTAGPTPT